MPESSLSPKLGYRLRATFDEVARVFSLQPGENRLGSADENDVVLATRGISRYHAILHVREEGHELEDLGSKNGTYVGGTAITRCQIALGDQFTLGPVSLDLQAIDLEDAQIGMVVEPPRPAKTLAPTPGDTTYLSAEHLGLKNYFRLVDEVLTRMAVRPTGDLEGALGSIVACLEVAGAAWVEWIPNEPPVVLGAAGQVGEAPSRRALRDARRRDDTDLRWLRCPAPLSSVCVVITLPGSEVLGLALWGDPPEKKLLEPLLGTLLHLFCQFRPRKIQAVAGSDVDAPLELRFPSQIVRGESPAMLELYQQMQQLLESPIPVLITGETGVGKEHLARVLHDSSPRAEGPFVAVNCAAIPSELLESEMFGVGRGVATGVERRRGKFLEANGGTLFLDELGDMAPPLQAKLLRVLQEGEVQPLGERPVTVDVRILAATNVDLHERMAAGDFRRDLYYRLAGYVLEPPPLRRRREDLPRLVGHFVRAVDQETRRSVHGLTVKALRALSTYSWPGNVRELEHEVRRLVFQCPAGGVIDSDMLSPQILSSLFSRDAEAENEPDPSGFALAPHLEAVERHLLRRALVHTGGNQSRAAKLLEISRNGLAKRLGRLGIDPAELME